MYNLNSQLRHSRKSSFTLPKPKEKLFELEKKIMNKTKSKHQSDRSSFVKKVINDIMCNEKSHIVAMFKDYLIFDDLSEFLKRFYKLSESHSRLLKVYDYYENYSKIFPNYIILREAKYIYKNIQRKQKMIDDQQKRDLENKNENKGNNNIIDKLKTFNKKDTNIENEKIFNTKVYESIMNQTDSVIISARDSVASINHNKNNNIDLLKLENSVYSIEKLIVTIGDAEKAFDKPPNTDRLRNDLISSPNRVKKEKHPQCR